MGINPLVVQQPESTKHQPFTASKIEITAKKMKCSKSTALAKFRIEFMRQHRDRAVWKMLVLIFNKFASNSYP